MRTYAAQGHRHDVSLEEYYEACRVVSSSGEEDGNESDQDSPNYWRSSCRSPLRGKARLGLHQRNSIQYARRECGLPVRRGCNAMLTASVLSRPVGGVFACAQSHGVGEGKGVSWCGAKGTMEECLIFDALCALQQSPSKNFETSMMAGGANGPHVWSLRKSVETAQMWERASFAVRALVVEILVGANDIARARWYIQELASLFSREDVDFTEDVFTDYSRRSTGEEGLLIASGLVLRRLILLVRALIDHIRKWAFRLQGDSNFSGIVSSAECKLQRGLQRVLLPLRRCSFLMMISLNITGEHDGMGVSATTKGPVDAVSRATALMDFLIIQMSALQDCNTMGLYRFYMVLLLHCSWPYVLLMTSAIFGFVTEIDAEAWRQKAPRIFCLSFSHIRVGSADGSDREAAELPTDILSLLLLCVGYDEMAAESLGDTGERCWDARRARRRTAFASVLSSRSFILRSFVAFARQKTLLAWSRKRWANRRVGHTEHPDEGGLCGTLPSEWESWRSSAPSGISHCRGAANPLTLVLCGESDDEGERECGLAPSQPEDVLWLLHVGDSKCRHDMHLVELTVSESTTCVPMWLHPSLPAARWITASLLVPIGQVMHRLQERRLAELLSPKAGRHHMGCLSDDDDTYEVSYMDGEVHMGNVDTRTALARQGDCLSLGRGSILVSEGITFLDAVRLLIDVALCRDSERVVYTFLSNLFHEPCWWFRRDAAEYAWRGSSSRFISTAFTDAMRGNPLGHLVRLVVAPKPAATEHQRVDEDHALEILRTFASFELCFLFPWNTELVLLPLSLSLEWGKRGNTRNLYASYFWRNRRCGVEGEAAAPLRTTSLDGRTRMQDGWSYCFGYLCSLYYTQISLREQRKRLQRRDVDAHHIMSSLGVAQKGGDRASSITRGLGSAYFELSFAVDSLLGFTQNIVGSVARELECELTRAGVVSSCISLCQRIDALILRLRRICFPVTPHLDEIEPLLASAPARSCIAALLAIALDPTSLPLRQVTSRTENAIETLVEVVRTLSSVSVLGEQLKPLLVRLTFNRFYGQ